MTSSDFSPPTDTWQWPLSFQHFKCTFCILGIFSKTGKTRVSRRVRMMTRWPSDPNVKDDPNDPLTRWPNDPVPRLVHTQQSRSLVRVGSNDKRIDVYAIDRFTFADNHCRAFSVLSFCVGTTCFLVTVAFTIYYYAGSCIRPDAVSATHDLTADTKVWELGDWRGKNQGRQGRLRPVHYERAACSIACKSITGFHALFVTCTCLHRA